MLALKVFLFLSPAILLVANPIVHAPWGTVRGNENVTEEWTKYNTFLGIPFAIPPVGNRRFARPEQHPGFNYTFNATTFGPSCMQDLKIAGIQGVDGDEDCLTLNIFTPAYHSEFSDIPVMVWIHGGGFVAGNAWSFDPSAIVARGHVIVVTIQYRIGVFGFLSTADDAAKGNYGLWDQHLALQWIKKNIRSFGGDDNRITIFGESAGSASVAYQALYPGSKGLFQRTIMQSGSVTSYFAHERDPLQVTMALAQKLNCNQTDETDHLSLIKCLRQISAKDLADASWPMSTDPVTVLFDQGFVPTTDGDFVEDDPLFLINDQDYLKRAGLQDLDCIVSVNNNEGGLVMISTHILDNYFNTTLSTSLLDTSNYKQYLISAVIKVYFGSSTPDMVKSVASENIPVSNHGETLDPQVLFDTVADPGMVVPTIAFARAHALLTHATQTGKKTYMYLFDQSPSFLPRKAKGLVHGEDVYFTFGLTNSTLMSLNLSMPTQAERELSHSLMDLLTDFARDGDPNPAVAFKLHEDWPEFTTAEEKYLLLDTQMSIASHPFNKKMVLWTKTLPQLLRKESMVPRPLNPANPIVHAPWGTIRGIENITEEWTTYHAFLGIPFAMPPVGDRRFARPETHPGFNYTFNATTFGPSCMQDFKIQGIHGVDGDEDCLTLNIYTPASHNEFSYLPVMVWIHGGGFILGNALIYDASPIVARGQVIVVTIQYRLGAFGFLSTADDAAKGNYGLWDQHLALQWIKKNIRSFGGDDNRITIFGESAGSASVAYQALYPGSKGLFQRTIMQSGSVSSTWAHKRKPLKDTMVLAQKLNCLQTGRPDHFTLIHCLRQVPAKALTEASWPMTTDPVTAFFDSGFVPTVDGDFIKDEPLVLMNDQDHLKLVGLQDLDCIVSVNSNEGGNLMKMSQILDNLFNSSLSSSLLSTSFYKHHLIKSVLHLYFGTSTPDMINAVASENIPASGSKLDPQVLFDTIADPQIVVPTIAFARAHAQLTHATQTGKKTYMYLFDQSPSFLPRKAKGLVHGEDVYFTFGLTNSTLMMLNLSMPTQAERELSHSLMDLLTDFARDGNPSPAVVFKIHGDWPEFTTTDEKYLLLDTQMSIKSHPFSSRMALWTKTLPQLMRDPKQNHQTTIDPRPDVIG